MEEVRKREGRALWASLFTALAFAAVLLPSLGRTRLMDVDEVIHSRAALEAARDGHWLPLTIEGRPWWEKPPLWPWLAALGLKAGLQKEAAVRLMPALAAVFALFFFARLATAAFGLLPGLALALAFAGQPDFLFHGRFFSMDTGLCACLLAATWFLWRDAEEGGGHGWKAGLALGLAAAIKSYFAVAVLLPMSLALHFSGAFKGRAKPLLLRLWAPPLAVLAAWLGAYGLIYGTSFLVQEWQVNLFGRATRNIAMDAGISNWLFYFYCADSAIPLLLPAWLFTGAALLRPSAVKAALKGSDGASFLRLNAAAFFVVWSAALMLIRTQNVNYLLPLTAWICLGLGLIALDLPSRLGQALFLGVCLLGLANVGRWPGEAWPVLGGLLAAPLALLVPSGPSGWGRPLSAGFALLALVGLFQGARYFTGMPDPNRKVVDSVLENPAQFPGEKLHYYGHWTDTLLFYSGYKVEHHGPIKGHPLPPAMVELGDRSVVFVRGKK